MSTFGKNKSIIRRTLADERLPNVVSKTITFMHQASGFAEFIDLNNLTVPTDAAAEGFSNPGASVFPFLRLYRQNISVETSYKGKLQDFEDYRIVNNEKIQLINITTEPGEIFVIKLVLPNNVDISSLQSELSNLRFSDKNYVMNSSFLHAQQGTSFSNPASGTTTIDRWGLDYDGTPGTFSISQQSFAVGEVFPDGTPAPAKYIRWNQTVAGTGNTYRRLRQRIEYVSTLAGKTVTLSFRARASVNGVVFGLRYEQFFGTGGSPSPSNGVDLPNTFSLTTTWTLYKATFVIPSIAGNTLGTDGNDWLGIQFKMPLNTTFQIDISNVMLNEGQDAADWRLMGRNDANELMLIKRYIERIDIMVNTYGGQYASTPNVFAGQPQPFSVQKRAIPICSYQYNGTGTEYWVIVGTTPVSANTTATLAIESTTTQWRLVQARISGGAAPFNAGYYIWEPTFSVTANAEL
jgi:hypothetical protein